MLAVVLDNIRSGENVGSIIRTAEALGFKCAILCGITPPVTHPRVLKASLGAEKNLKIEKFRDCWRVIEKLRREGFYAVALETKPKGKVSISKVLNSKSYILNSSRIALIVGNEVRGVGKAALKRANAITYIPMRGKKESLNVAVAFGIAAFSLTRS